MESVLDPNKVINAGGEELKETRVNIVIRCTKLIRKKDGSTVFSVNQSQKKELERLGYQFIGLSTVGFWGKIDS